jgi:uncharacterized damage-inducible protein DinB
MPTKIADSYRRWFDYEIDAHLKTLASLETESRIRGAAQMFQKSVDLFAHIVAARRLWLFRLGVSDESPRELFPQAVAFETLAPAAEKMHAEWLNYLSRMDDGELGRVFDYRSFDGPWFRNTVEDTLTQLFGHSWYHRGQIALLLRSGGGEPAATDFVFWCRQPINGVTGW